MENNYRQDIIRHLPQLIVEHLLSFLNTQDRLKLRLVSQTTKSWIETPEFLCTLEHFPDRLVSISQAVHIFKTWNHTRLNIAWKENDPVFLSLVHCVGPSLKYLKMDRFWASPAQIRFLNCCHALESLSVGCLFFDSSSTMNVQCKDFQQFACILGLLEHFHIGSIKVRYPAGLEIEYCTNLLHCLLNIKTLNVPAIVEKDGQPINPLVNSTLQYGFVICPIINYIQMRKSTTYQILQSLDMAAFNGNFFEFFPDLLEVCQNTGTVLENVNYDLVAKYVRCRHDLKLLRVVKSLTNLVGSCTTFAFLQNVCKMSLDLSRCQMSIPSEQEKILLAKNQPLFPKLKEVELQLWVDDATATEVCEGQISQQEMVATLFEHQGLQKLTINWTPHHYYVLVFVETLFSETFTSLTILKITSFFKFSNAEFSLIVSKLKKLQELMIEDEWGTLTDCGICEQDEQGVVKLLSLVDLKKLYITCSCKYDKNLIETKRLEKVSSMPDSKLKEFSKSCSDKGISDFSFKSVFRHMKLQSFLVQSAAIYVTKYGYHALKQSELAYTVELLPFPKHLPTKLTSEDFWKLRSGFRHFQPEPDKDKATGTHGRFCGVGGQCGIF